MRTRNFLSSIVMLLFLCSMFVHAQVTGIVVDDNGPLPGALITVVETGVTTETDEEGNFSIEAEIGNNLNIMDPFTFMEQSYPITKLDMGEIISGGGAVELGEIITTGYYNLEETKVSSAVTVVGADDIEKVTNVTSIDNSLQGKVAGLQITAATGRPGQVGVARIRGIGNIEGGEDPIYVVDGVIMNTDQVGALNSADVQTVTVLKDAASSALYGPRAADGVIVITTKNARKGNTRFMLNSSFGFQNRVNDNVKVMNAKQYLNLEQLYAAAGAQNIPVRTDEERLILIQNGTSWPNDIYKEGGLSSNQFSASTADDNTTFYASFGYDKNEGLVNPWKGWERISGRMKVDQDLKYDINIGANIAMSYESDDRPRDSFNILSPIFSAYNNSPIVPVYEKDNNGNIILDDEGKPIYSSGPGLQFGLNYFDIYSNYDRTSRQLRTFGDVYAEFKDLFAVQGFGFKTQFSGIYTRDVFEQFTKPGSIIGSAFGTPDGYKLDRGSDEFRYRWLNTLSYKRTFNEKHTVDAILFSDWDKTNYYGYRLESQGYPNGFLTVQSVSATPVAAWSERNDEAIYTLGANLNYDYVGKYFLTASVSRSGLSSLPSDSRYGYFPGVSFGWMASDEAFLKSVDWISKLKLRVSWGEIGKRRGLPRYYFTGISTGNVGGEVSSSFPDSQVAQPLLKWEVNKNTDVGLEWSMFNNRLNLVADYFHQNRTDFYFPLFLPWESGWYDGVTNSGKVTNSGFEITINGDIIRKKNLNWNVYGNITFLGSKVHDLGGDETKQPRSPFVINKVGEELNTFNLVRYAGVNEETGEAMYYDLEGNLTNVYSSDNAVVHSGKSPTPEHYGGFGTKVEVYGFDFGLDFVFQAGNYIYNQQQEWLTDNSRFPLNRDVKIANFWKNSGDKNVLPRPVNDDGGLVPNQFSDRFLQKGDYVRLRNLNLGYTFGENILGDIPIERVRLYIQGQNLVTWTDFDGDPEVGILSEENFDTIRGAAYRWGYPNAKQWLFGVQVNF